MNVEITTKPCFSFTVSKSVIDILKQLSQFHYDSTCREASYTVQRDGKNGILTIWLFHPSPNTENHFDVYSASWRDLDTVLKIAELNNTLPEFKKQELEAFTTTIYKAMKYAACHRFEWAAIYNDTNT